MSESLLDFFQTHPFWAILIIIFMILPIAGAVLHIILKAFGRRGIDNAPTYQEPPPIKDDGDGSPVEGKPNDTKNPSKT